MPGTAPPLARSGARSVRLIAIDIDGTLLDSHSRLPEPNRTAIHAALGRGAEVVLATGRAFHHARPVAGLVGADVLLIVSNGALVKTPGGETLATRLVPRALAREVVVSAREVRDGAALVFDRADARQYVWERVDWSHPHRAWYYERNRVFMTGAEDLTAALEADPIQIAFTGGVREMRRLADHLRAQPCAATLTLTLTEYEARDFTLLDVTAEGCSKGAALADWARQRSIPPAQVMALGDNLNDREMLEFAGYPVVMGNAVPALKQLGWPATLDSDRAGVAHAIDALLLS